MKPKLRRAIPISLIPLNRADVPDFVYDTPVKGAAAAIIGSVHVGMCAAVIAVIVLVLQFIL